MLRTKEALETLLHEIDKESGYYDLRLNLGKCELLEMNGNQENRFRSGAKMKKVDKAKYIGGILTKKAASNTRRPLALRSSRLLQGPPLVLWKLRSTGTAHTRTQGYHQSSDSFFVAVFQTFPGPVLGCIDADFSTKAFFCSIFQALQD